MLIHFASFDHYTLFSRTESTNSSHSAIIPICAAEFAPSNIHGVLVTMWQMPGAFGTTLGFCVPVHRKYTGRFAGRNLNGNYGSILCAEVDILPSHFLAFLRSC